MKFHLTLVAFLCLARIISFAQYSNKNLLQEAFSAIVEDLKTRNYLLSVVVENVSSKNTQAAVLATSSVPHAAVKWSKKQSKTFELNSSAIVLLDSMASVKLFNNHTIFPFTYSMSQQLFFYCHNATFRDLLEIPISRYEPPIMQYEYFVIEDEESFRLLTFLWYKPQKCDIAELVEINKFDKSNGAWLHQNFRMDKFSNLYGCRINFAIRTGMPAFLALEFDNTTETITKCLGYNCALVRDFSSTLNYTYHMDVIGHSGNRTFPKKPCHLFMNIGLLSWLHSLNQTQKKEMGIFTRVVQVSEIFMAIPPGDDFNGYEKLVLPFDEPTWRWIGITFASAFVTIFALRFTRTDIANFVMGRNTETPVLNVLRAFFGISQINCPTRNFARYLLMLFILFSLIVRTAYQGKMFEFLQKEMRKPTVTTIDEMIDQNFTFYMTRLFKEFYPSLDIIKRANIVDRWQWNELIAAYDSLYTPGTKTGVFYQAEFFQFIAEELKRSKPPKLLEARFMLDSLSLLIPPFHFLSNLFDQKLQRYIEAGFIDCHIGRWFSKHDPKKFAVYKEPFAILTLGELEAGFVVCLLPIALSLLVFIIEWMATLKDLIVFSYVFKIYFEAKKSEQKLHSELMNVRITAQALSCQVIKIGEAFNSTGSNSDLVQQDFKIVPEGDRIQNLYRGEEMMELLILEVCRRREPSFVTSSING